MNTTFPHHTPLTPVLDSIERDRRTLAAFTENELLELANEVRQFLLYSVANTGGHFGAGLGVVELTVALHHVLNTPSDRLVWDVGHQTYPHKMLTGRRARVKQHPTAGRVIRVPKAKGK